MHKNKSALEEATFIDTPGGVSDVVKYNIYSLDKDSTYKRALCIDVRQ